MSMLKDFVVACFSPVGLITVLFVAGLLLRLFRREWRVGGRMLAAGAGLYLLLVLTPLSEALYANLEHPYPPMLKADASARTVVVLAAYGEDMPFLPVTSKLTGEMIPRLAEGIRLYREIPGARLVLSGGVVRRHDGPVARLMADFAVAMGVPERDIVIEGRARNTYENLSETRKIIGAEPFILVTSSAEMRRAVAVARKLAMRPLPAPAAIWAARYYPAGMSWLEWAGKVAEDSGEAKAHRLTYLQRAYHEYVGYLWYWVLDRV
jgi:uncharacterized SAM-binding protein YcdF (DUF218 family)